MGLHEANTAEVLSRKVQNSPMEYIIIGMKFESIRIGLSLAIGPRRAETEANTQQSTRLGPPI